MRDRLAMSCRYPARLPSRNQHRQGLASLNARMNVLSRMSRQFTGCGPSNFLYSDSDTRFIHTDQGHQDISDSMGSPALQFFECYSNEILDLVCEIEPPKIESIDYEILVASDEDDHRLKLLYGNVK